MSTIGGIRGFCDGDSFVMGKPNSNQVFLLPSINQVSRGRRLDAALGAYREVSWGFSLIASAVFLDQS